MQFQLTTDLSALTPQSIEFNFDELKSYVSERAEHYKAIVVTEEAIPVAKSDRAQLCKLVDAIDTARKDVKREWLKPYKDFQRKCNEIIAPLNEAITNLDTQVKGFEELKKAEKQEQIEELYKIKTAGHEDVAAVIPFDRLFDPKWLNTTVPMSRIESEMDHKLLQTKSDMDAIEAMDSGFNGAMLLEYTKTLNLAAAIAYGNHIKEVAKQEAERKAQQEALNRQREAEANAKSNLTAATNIAPAGAQADEKRYVVYLEIKVTKSQVSTVKAALEEQGIDFKFISSRREEPNE